MAFGSGEPKAPTLDPFVLSWGKARFQEIRQDRLRSEVERLIGPHNRLHAPEAMQSTEDALAQLLEEFGWETESRPFRLENVEGGWDYGKGERTTFPILEGTNIVAIKKGTQEPKEAVAVIAHYDTCRDTPGADDNTASVVSLLELARILQRESFQKTVILGLTDMEELEWVGARVLASQMCKDYKVTGVLVLETLAYVDLRPHSLKIESFKTGPLYQSQLKRMRARDWAASFTLVLYHGLSSSLAATFSAALESLCESNCSVPFRDPGDLPFVGFLLRKMDPNLVRQFQRSDHVPFWRAGIPAIQVTDGANFSNPHYHQPSDLPSTLDFGRLAGITGAVAIAVGVYAGLLRK